MNRALIAQGVRLATRSPLSWLALLVALALVPACAREPDHSRYTRALHLSGSTGPEPSEHDAGGMAGWDICLTIGEVGLRGDCEASVAARSGWFDRCGQIEATTWRDECWFEAAESQSRAGNAGTALGACVRSGFAMQCQDHVLGMVAMGWLGLPVSEVGLRFAALRVNKPGTSLGFLFWRHFYRNRIAQGMPATRVGCMDGDCRGAAETEVAAALSMAVAGLTSGGPPGGGLGSAGPPGGTSKMAICAALPRFAWDQDADSHRMAERAWRNACAEHPVGRYHGLP